MRAPDIDASLLSRVRAIASRKLGLYGGFTPQDVEDVASEAVLLLVERLHAGAGGEAGEAGGEGHAPIINLDAYAATVTYTCCAHLIRRRAPERARLKARLRYVLAGDPRFAIWDAGDMETIAGRAEWRARPAPPEATRALDVLAESPPGAIADGRVRASETPAQLGALLHAIFEVTGGPVEFDRLVGAVARLCGIALDAAPRLTNDRPAADDWDARIDDRRLLERSWREVSELPVRQRVALLLSLRDSRGSGLLWLLPVLGLATIRQIAALLEIPANEMAMLWGRLPLDDHAIAARLGCTRQQVINLRMAGRKRLSSRLRRSDKTRDRAWRGNLVGDSSSMDHET